MLFRSPGLQEDLGDAGEPVSRALVRFLDGTNRVEHVAPGLTGDRLEQLFLRAEVVVQQTVGNTCLFRDVADSGRVVALAREDANGCIEDEPALVLLPG